MRMRYARMPCVAPTAVGGARTILLPVHRSELEDREPPAAFLNLIPHSWTQTETRESVPDSPSRECGWRRTNVNVGAIELPLSLQDCRMIPYHPDVQQPTRRNFA